MIYNIGYNDIIKMRLMQEENIKIKPIFAYYFKS